MVIVIHEQLVHGHCSKTEVRMEFSFTYFSNHVPELFQETERTTEWFFSKWISVVNKYNINAAT